MPDALLRGHSSVSVAKLMIFYDFFKVVRTPNIVILFAVYLVTFFRYT